MKGDEVVEAVELLADKSLLIYRRHADHALQQFIEEEIEPDTTFLQHFDLLCKQPRLKPMPKKAIVAGFASPKDFVEGANNYISAGRLIAD